MFSIHILYVIDGETLGYEQYAVHSLNFDPLSISGS